MAKGRFKNLDGTMSCRCHGWETIYKIYHFGEEKVGTFFVLRLFLVDFYYNENLK